MSLKLDIGCGGRGTMYPEFIGIDKWPKPDNSRKSGTQYVQLDFVYSALLPWQPGTVEEIVCFHVIEHMTDEEGEVLLRRIYSLLQPGGRAYVSCPDNRLFAAQYIVATSDTATPEEKEQADAFWRRAYPKNGKEMWPGRTTLRRFFNQMRDNIEWGHVTPYDQETLEDAAVVAGIPADDVAPLPDPHYWRRRDHECGIIITKK